MFRNDFGEVVLAVQCPNCGFPVAIVNPEENFFDYKESGKVFIEIWCYWCGLCSFNEVTRESYQRVQNFIEEKLTE
jgi:hypothetical protein